MGPFPHDAPPATISDSNPAGTDGFEFVEFAHPEPEQLAVLFERMGYAQVARHRTKNITVWRQGDINYILNARAWLACDELRREARALRAVDGVAGRRCQACLQARRREGRDAL